MVNKFDCEIRYAKNLLASKILPLVNLGCFVRLSNNYNFF